jgi:lipopolysaccharide export LptBFGC system permease protein LptF
MDKSFLIFLAVPIFFLMAFIEFLWGLKIGKNNYRINDAFAGVALGLISRFPTILNIVFIIGIKITLPFLGPLKT